MTNTESSEYLAKQVIQIFHLDMTADGLKKAANRGTIPPTVARKRGKKHYRYWHVADLPKIGEKYGVFKKPKKQQVIATYVPKGGVGKTFWSYNFARILALHGIKTLLVGLDFQCSLSKSFGIDYDGEELPLSIFDSIINDVPLAEVIVGTDIPTLDLVPESDELSMLDRQILYRNKREYILKGLLDPLKDEYDVIIIDCPPQWMEMVTNSLVAANAIVSPILCGGESYHSFKKFVRELDKFSKLMGTSWDLVKFIPNKLGRNKYSKSFRNKYIADYPEVFTNRQLKDSIVIEESGTALKSVLEYSPKSAASDEFYDVALEVWDDLLQSAE